MTKSIASRVFLLLGSFASLLCFVFLALSLIFSYVVEDAIFEKILDREERHVLTRFSKNGFIPASRLEYIQIHHDGSTLPKDVKKALKRNPRKREFFTSSDEHYHARFAQLPDDTRIILLLEAKGLLVVTNISPVLLRLWVIAFLIVLLLALLATYYIGKLSIRPILQLSASLEQQKKMDSSTVVLPFFHDREVDYLSRNLEENINLLRSSLAREKQFTRDVSHELRNPLTVQKNTITLIETRGLETNDLEHLRESTEYMEKVVEVLLTLARPEGLNFESCNLIEIAENAILDLHKKATLPGIEIDLFSGDECTNLEANPTLLKILFRNLIENAIKYSADNKIAISLNPKELLFSNKKSGSLPTLKCKDLLKPGVKSKTSSGLGQGLFLTSRIVDAFGWKIEIDSNCNNYTVQIILS